MAKGKDSANPISEAIARGIKTFIEKVYNPDKKAITDRLDSLERGQREIRSGTGSGDGK